MGIPIWHWTKDENGNEKQHTTWLHEGCVLADRERNYRDDSDFYAIFWDEEQQRVTEWTYGTTSAHAPRSCIVDATPEVVEKALDYLLRKAEPLVREWLEKEQESLRNRIAVGAYVEVTGGRKLPKGTKGYVAAVMENDFDPANKRVALQVGDQMAYTYQNNLTVLEPNRETLDELGRLYQPHVFPYYVRQWVMNEASRWTIRYDWRPVLFRLAAERYPELREEKAVWRPYQPR